MPVAAILLAADALHPVTIEPWYNNMKKVLIISASPRKGGNSDLLCDEFAKGAIEA